VRGLALADLSPLGCAALNKALRSIPNNVPGRERIARLRDLVLVVALDKDLPEQDREILHAFRALNEPLKWISEFMIHLDTVRAKSRAALAKLNLDPDDPEVIKALSGAADQADFNLKLEALLTRRRGS
jgi:hypothetical protein